MALEIQQYHQPVLTDNNGKYLCEQVAIPYSHIYLEGTDACGKDTLADLMVSQQIEGIKDPARKSATYFMDDSRATIDSWREQYPDKEFRPALLLAATIRDLCLAGLATPDQLAAYQASHDSIRGTAHEKAFGTSLQELFDESTHMVPPAFLPVALRADLGVLADRVKNNPLSTPFDYMVIEQPDKVAKMLDIIEDRCVRLGGIAIDTSDKAPGDIVTEIIAARPNRAHEPIWTDPRVVIMRGVALLDCIKNMPQYRQLAPLMDKIAAELYAR